MPMAMPARHSSTWTKAEAQRVLAALDDSGLTVAAYARRHGLLAKRLYAWRAKLRPAPRLARTSPTFVELVAAPSRSVAAMRIVCPTGHHIELDVGDLAEGLRVALIALQQVHAC